MARLLKPVYVVSFPSGFPYVNLGIESNVLRRKRPVLFDPDGHATFNRTTRLPDLDGPHNPVEELLP